MRSNLIKRVLSSIILLPIVFFLIIDGGNYFELFLVIIFLITCYEWHILSKKNYFYFLGYFFFILSFYSAFYLRTIINDEYKYLLSVVIICIFTDIGGYFFGKIFKGPKIGKISPNKTYSGIFGGYFSSFFFLYLIYETKLLTSSYLILDYKFFIFIALVSSVSQGGDLIISYFKRLSNIKDTGIIIPGHGGILDRIDGMIFAIPFSFVLLKIQIFY